MSTKKVLAFSLPLIVANVIVALNGFAAMWVLSWLGYDGAAAGALVYNTFGVMASIVFSISIPVSVFVAHAFGAKNYLDISRIVQAGSLVVIALGSIVAFGVWDLKPAYAFFHQPADAAAIAAGFFKGYAFALIPFGLRLVFSGVFNGTSKPHIATLFSLIGLLLTAPLSYCFGLGKLGMPALGAFGVGLGAAVGSLITLGITFFYLKYSRNYRQLKLFNFKKQGLGKWIKDVLAMGIPVSAQRVGEVTAMFAITVLIGHLGKMQLASYQVALQFSFVVLMVGFGFTQASSILVGQSLGQGKPNNATKDALASIKIAFFIALTCSAVFVFFPHQLIHVFISDRIPHVKEITMLATALLAIVAISQVFDTVRNVATGALRGYRDTKYPMYLGFMSCWAIGVPLAYLLLHTAHLGAKGAVIGFTVGVTLGAVLTCLRLLKKQRESLSHRASTRNSGCVDST
jgi:multidrug resistance protein, MATE family